MATVDARLASLETEAHFIRDDLTEVKADVKSLLLGQANLAGRNGLLGAIARGVPWAALVAAIIAVVHG